MSTPSFLKKLFRRNSSTVPIPPVAVPEKVEISRVEPQKMTLLEWRQRETLVAESMRLARNTVYQSQIDILKNEHPARLMFQPIGVSANDRLAHQAKIEGYELCLSYLLKFSTSFKKPEAIESTFEPTVEQRNQK